MALIVCPQHRAEDLEAWSRYEAQDRAMARSCGLRDLVRQSTLEIERFVGGPCYAGPCYAGWSGGKDSVVLWHLLWSIAEDSGVRVPIVCVRSRPIDPPYRDRVRDEMLARWPLEYHEIDVWCQYSDGEWHAKGTLERGFANAAQRFGERYLSGIRAQESAGRCRRLRHWGMSTERTCAPISHWRSEHVWGYIYAHDLPVHPTYAMGYGGRIDRGRLRVASLTLRRGRGRGREQWESDYYGWRLREIGLET